MSQSSWWCLTRLSFQFKMVATHLQHHRMPTLSAPVLAVENVDEFAAENATTRSLAENWIDGDPLRDCVRCQLFIGSERYERMMYGEGVRRDNRAVGGARRLPYRMLVSARGDLHENFQRHVAIMFNSSIRGARIDVRPSSEGHGTCCNFPSAAK